MSEQPDETPAVVLGHGTDVEVDPAPLEAAAGPSESADPDRSTPDELGGTAGGNAGGAG